MKQLQQLHWPLILGLGALTIIHPLLNVTGIMNVIGRPFGPLLITVLISIVWIGTVLLIRVQQPLVTLIFTGLASGLYVSGIVLLLALAQPGNLPGLLTYPIAMLAILGTNALWGLLSGLLALVLHLLARSGNPQRE